MLLGFQVALLPLFVLLRCLILLGKSGKIEQIERLDLQFAKFCDQRFTAGALVYLGEEFGQRIVRLGVR